MDEMIQVIGIVGAIKNYVDSSKGIFFTIDRKFKEELHKIDDLFQTEVIVQIIPIEMAQKMVKETEYKVEMTDEPKVNDLTMRKTIFQIIRNCGLELQKEQIYKAYTGKEHLRELTIEELVKFYDFIVRGEELPITNHAPLRDKLLKLLEAE